MTELCRNQNLIYSLQKSNHSKSFCASFHDTGFEMFRQNSCPSLRIKDYCDRDRRNNKQWIWLKYSLIFFTPCTPLRHCQLYIYLAGEADECDITILVTAQQWLPYIVWLSLRALGKAFSLNASFTARCSGSTKSTHILNREQRMKRVKEKERLGGCPATVRSPGRASIQPRLTARGLDCRQRVQACVSPDLSSDLGALDHGALDLGVRNSWEIAGNCSLWGEVKSQLR